MEKQKEHQNSMVLMGTKYQTKLSLVKDESKK